ncbi:MAG: efflux RND transporter periplasmic adaptor subunit, partial [Myxococcota bacterium]
MKNHKTLVTAIQIAALLGVIVAVVKLWPKDAVEVGVVHLEKGDVLDMVTTVSSGTVKAARYARIRSSAMGDVEKVLVHKGETVKKGAVVVRLKNREHRARVDLARANLAAGGASRRQTELRKGQFDRNLDRTRKLFDQKVAPESSLEQVTTERDVSAEMINAADANISQLRAGLDIAEAAYDSTFIRAPFDGTIAAISVEEGEALSLGLPVFEIYDGSSVRIEAALDETDSARVTVGMPVSLSTDAAPGRIIEGRVTWIAPMVSHDLKGSRSVDITIEPLKPEQSLKVGMPV